MPTNPICIEAHALLLRKLGRGIALEWLLMGGLGAVAANPRAVNAAVRARIVYWG
jgi:hypothetical protein